MYIEMIKINGTTYISVLLLPALSSRSRKKLFSTHFPFERGDIFTVAIFPQKYFQIYFIPCEDTELNRIYKMCVFRT
jgi:hypothetical protein